MPIRISAFALFFLSMSTFACEITPKRVQSDALAFLKREYPKESFAPGRTFDVILMGEMEFGLQHLRSGLCLARPPLSGAALDEALRAHFHATMMVAKDATAKFPSDWAQAQELVTLQFMPADYLRPFEGKRVLVTQPLLPGVELAVVLEQKDGYAYVREEDRIKWKVEAKLLFETALRNLDLNNTNAKLQGGDDPNRFLAIEEKDGYDAVRLLLPWVREEATKFLGEPFLAAIPNRDFLVMWSTRNGADFQTFARKRALDDFNSQPYPLTAQPVKVWADGRMELVP